MTGIARFGQERPIPIQLDLFTCCTERTIAEIEWLERTFAVPDTRPMSPSDLRATNRRHDDMLAHSLGFGFGRATASVADRSLMEITPARKILRQMEAICRWVLVLDCFSFSLLFRYLLRRDTCRPAKRHEYPCTSSRFEASAQGTDPHGLSGR